jgi:hypothetical protein
MRRYNIYAKSVWRCEIRFENISSKSKCKLTNPALIYKSMFYMFS